jgi:hypothetical protein
LLALTALLTLIKTVVMVYRHKKYPIFPTKEYDENSRESCSYERAAFIDMPPGNVMV